MSQHDFDIANQSASSARADINNALKALASLSSGNTAPSTTYANMLWYETDTNTLKMRAEADDAWISIGYLNQSTDTFALFDDTKIVNSGGTQTGLLGDQSTSVWESGTGATESLVSPAKVKAAINAFGGGIVSSDFSGADGYVKLGNDLILQWGQKNPTSGTTTVTFDLTFPNQVLFIGSQLIHTSQNYQSTAIDPNYTTSGFTLYNDTQDFWWWALGR
jgi:hypothetical protein